VSDVLVLCYHAVSEDWPASLAVTPGRLRAQLAILVRRGYDGATFTEAVGRDDGRNRLAVTFDDAYRSVFELARPILAELGLPGTVFAPTAHIGGERPMGWPGIDHWLGGPHERELVPMSWPELSTLRQEGWEVGSHTVTHPRLPELDADSLRVELEESRAECGRRVGSPCLSIAYPYGDASPRVADAARAAGYAAGGAFAGRVRRPHALLWPRVGIYRHDTEARFRMKVSPAMRHLRGSPAWRARFVLRRPRT
jgi:peptidoglycan/xylan/chitin deacetylase (PgdA/CDA1 family)